MTIDHGIARRVRQIAGPVFGISLVVYFTYYTIHGDRGLNALTTLQAEIESAEETLEVVSAERRLIEHRVSLLRPESLDADMLEERARAVLNMGRADEMVIPLTRRPDGKDSFSAPSLDSDAQ